MSDDKMPTTCLNCGETAELTTLETLKWMDIHGPGKCKSKAAKK